MRGPLSTNRVGPGLCPSWLYGWVVLVGGALSQVSLCRVGWLRSAGLRVVPRRLGGPSASSHKRVANGHAPARTTREWLLFVAAITAMTAHDGLVHLPSLLYNAMTNKLNELGPAKPFTTCRVARCMSSDLRGSCSRRGFACWHRDLTDDVSAQVQRVSLRCHDYCVGWVVRLGDRQRGRFKH